MIQRLITQNQVCQRINTYFLAVEPLMKIAMKIELNQPITYQIGNDGTIERIEQCGWSEEAKELYAKVMQEIEHMRELYLKKGDRLHE